MNNILRGIGVMIIVLIFLAVGGWLMQFQEVQFLLCIAVGFTLTAALLFSLHELGRHWWE